MSTPAGCVAEVPERDFGLWAETLKLATREVFQMMLGSELVSLPGAASKEDCGFTAMVGLAGSLCGVLSIRCAPATATLIASKMLGAPPEEVLQEQWDAAGEACNMVAGNFKAKLPGMAEGCMLSVPTVITGADYRLYSLADGGSIEAGFLFEGHALWIALEVHA